MSRSLPSPSTGHAKLDKPVFAPELAPLDQFGSRLFLELQQESYDRAGAPRLHMGDAAGEDTNALVRVRLPDSGMTPALRQVFIPSRAKCTSFLIEAADGEPGLFSLSADFTAPAPAVQMMVMPYTRLTDIAQGDHEGVLQVTLPGAEVLSTTIVLTRLETGDCTYVTRDTAASFSALTNNEITDLIREVDDDYARRVAALLSGFVFQPPPVTRAANAVLRQGEGVDGDTKRWLVGALQTVGAVTTLDVARRTLPRSGPGARLTLALAGISVAAGWSASMIDNFVPVRQPQVEPRQDGEARR